MQLAESEVRGLCLKSREIFLNQPILLELEAPLKICGKLNSYDELQKPFAIKFKCSSSLSVNWVHSLRGMPRTNAKLCPYTPSVDRWPGE